MKRIKRVIISVCLGMTFLLGQILSVAAAVEGPTVPAIEVRSFSNNFLVYLEAPGSTAPPFLTTPKGIYRGADRYGNDLSGQAVYCLEAAKDSPNNLLFQYGNGNKITGAMNYVLSHGFKRGWSSGTTDMDAKYSLGSPQTDYYITQMAMHIIAPNEPYSLETFAAVAGRNRAIYDKIALLVQDAYDNDAAGNAISTEFSITPEVNGAENWENYSYEGKEGYLSQEFSVSGYLENAVWHLSDSRAVRIPSDSNSPDGNFRVWISKEAVMENCGGILQITLEGSIAQLGGYTYSYSAPNIQSVTFQQMVFGQSQPAAYQVTAVYPEVPKVKVAKLADKTTGAELSDGRYMGSKIPGTYYPDEVVDYTLTVTNSGNTLLRNVKLEDTMEERLKKYVLEGSGAFFAVEGETKENGEIQETRVQLEEGINFKTIQGKDIHVISNTDTSLVLDGLEPGDAAVIHYQVQLVDSELFQMEDDLRNDVLVTADYGTREEIKGQVPQDEDDSDFDRIQIRHAKVKISKLADRTTGVKELDYRYEGTKKPGDYRQGESVDYKILVANSGSLDVTNLRVEDVMDKYLVTTFVKDTLSFQLPDNGTFTSVKGDTIQAELKDSQIILLDHLKVGDAVELHMKAQIKEDAHVIEGLDNQVKVTGTYNRDGQETSITEDEDDWDEDAINVIRKIEETRKTETTDDSSKKITTTVNPVITSSSVNGGGSLMKTASTTSQATPVKTGDATPIALYLFLLFITGGGIFLPVALTKVR